MPDLPSSHWGVACGYALTSQLRRDKAILGARRASRALGDVCQIIKY